jgi:general stress protein 26
MTDAAPPPIPGGAVAAVIALLEAERLLSLAVNRPDGWPQATTVGYVNEGLNLYIVVARTSQKLANMQADPRVSVAIRSEARQGDAIGVSMAARATEITDPVLIERLDRSVRKRYPDMHVFGPGADSIAVVHLSPEVISPVSVIAGRSDTQTFSLQPIDAASSLPSSPRLIDLI